MCRIPLVKHAVDHDRQQNKIFNKVNQDAPPELVCATDDTGMQSWRPFGVTLSSS